VLLRVTAGIISSLPIVLTRMIAYNQCSGTSAWLIADGRSNHLKNGKTMNRKDYLQAIVERSGLTVPQIETALAATTDTIKDIMINNDSLLLPGFGAFGAKVRAARTGRNPSTQEPIDIPETNVPYFKASANFSFFLKPFGFELFLLFFYLTDCFFIDSN